MSDRNKDFLGKPQARAVLGRDSLVILQDGLERVVTTQQLADAINSGLDVTLVATTITEGTAGAGITIANALIEKHTTVAINSTATATAAQVALGYITSTSAAATSITLPTATLLATQLGAVQGTVFDFYVDNTAGANTVTVIVGSGIVAAVPIITGGATLTIGASATQGIGAFRLVFSSATAAVLYRLG